MSVGPKYGVLGSFRVLTSETRVNVSRFGAHRSNEWDSKYANVFVVHAARDQAKTRNHLKNLK
jgi:hypothetical protein